MMSFQNFRKIVGQWIQSVSEAIGIPLVMSEEGVLAFSTPGSELVVVIEVPYEEYDFMCLYSEMMPFSPKDEEDKAALCAQLLSLSALQNETDRGAIALSPGEEKVLYCKRFSIESLQNVEAFAAALTKFTKTALNLKKMITNPPSLSDGEPKQEQGQDAATQNKDDFHKEMNPMMESLV
jgi:hypothetical protein